MTISLFILSGAELAAQMHFAGPLGSNPEQDINSGEDLQKAIDEFDGSRQHGSARSVLQVVNFEHLNLGEDGAVQAGDEEETITVLEDEAPEQRRERRTEERKKALEARQRKEQSKIKQKKLLRDEGEPFQLTFNDITKGWYRYCVNTNSQVVVEIDFRKESEMGGIDEKGHVWTYDQKVMEEADRMMEEDTAVEEGIKDADFEMARAKLKTLRRLLADIQNKQNQERHRLVLHAATNEHSHSRMVLSSLFETLMFVVVSGFQVYTIRRWFKGASVLG
jgi:hypothetical protein